MIKFNISFAIISFVLAASTSQFALAKGGNDVGYMLGVKDATFSSSASTAPTFTSEAGIMAGAIVVGDLNSTVMFRSGGYYAERTAKSTLSGATSTIKFSYLDVPVTVLYKFNDMVGVFGGVALGLKVADSCSGDTTVCSSTNGGYSQPSSFTTAAQLGLNVKFDPNWAGEIFYEVGLGNVSQSTSASALSAGVMFIY